jgi:hypothetical protein
MPSFRNETSILPKKLVCPVSRDFAHIHVYCWIIRIQGEISRLRIELLLFLLLNKTTSEENWIIGKVREGEVEENKINKEIHVTNYRCSSRLYSWKE